jgi:hypothetical protein
MGVDRENLVAGLHQQNGLIAHMTEQFSIAHLRAGNTGRQIGAGGLGLFLAHGEAPAGEPKLSLADELARP